LAELKTLANIIQSSVEQIEAVVTSHSLHLPSPESPFSLESEAPRMHPSIQSAGLLITSAAAQLMTLVRPAPVALLDIMNQVRLKIISDPRIIAYDGEQRSSMFRREFAQRLAPMLLRSFVMLDPM
jgi:hypothetical protein